MRYFGRSYKEQFNDYTAELLEIEKKIFFNHYKEIVELLEAAEDATDYRAMGMRSGDEERDLYRVQKKIRKLTNILDVEVAAAITKHFLKLREKCKE